MATASSLVSQGQRRGRWAEARGLTAWRLVKELGVGLGDFLKQRKLGLCALTIPDPPLIHCILLMKSGFSKAPVAGAECLWMAGLAGLEQAKAPSTPPPPPQPPLLHSPTAQSPPPRPRLQSGCFIAAGRLCLFAPQLPAPAVLGLEKCGRGAPSDCLCPLPRPEIWEVGCWERMWVNNLRPGEGSCQLCLPPAALELDAVYCGAPQSCRVSEKSFPKLPEVLGQPLK